MQAAYVDRYEEELQIAIEKADYIPSCDQHKIPSYRYVGRYDGGYESRHYYCEPSTGRYYYESDFAREMRLKIRNNRFRNFRKK